MSDKLIGKTLAGRFVLEELLGTGATGAVYRAQQTSVDRVVAVKTLHTFLQQREDFKARFEIEAKAIARLNHPNCITLYDFGYDEEFDVFYMAVEYIKGQQLGDMMAEPILQDDVLSISYQVADALEHAHREGILHRDLKPENIMIQVFPDSGRLSVKVLDFGLARLYESATSEESESDEPPSGRYKQITQAGQVYGTPAYMSPEQCRAKGDLTPATDIYALGTMMFELLEGRLPFFSKSTAELIMMQMTEDPPQLTRMDVAPELRQLVHSMMQKDPTKRPQSAKEVQLTLLPYVRIDASQELRIVPSASGEFANLTQEQIAAFSRAVDQSGERGAVRTMEMSSEELAAADPAVELSDDEMRAAARKSALPLALGLVAVSLIGALGLAVTLSDDDASASPATVDAAAAHVAQSTGEDTIASDAEEESVEVAETDPVKNPDKQRKRPSPKKKPKKPEAGPAASNNGKSGRSPNAKDRPKTLKLEY